jgi:hypothetical protein
MEQQLKIVRTTNDNEDFIALVKALDKVWGQLLNYKKLLAKNIIEFNPNVIVVYWDNKPVACSC